MPDKRPVFHPTIGRFLAELREAREWSQGQAVIHAKGRIKIGTLKSLEAGRVKHPDASDLRTLAQLYGVSYESLASRFVEANYGSDLIRHTWDQLSGTPAGASHDPASSRLLKLESENRDLHAALKKVTNVASRLVQIAKVGAKGRASDGRRSRSRGRDRKAS